MNLNYRLKELRIYHKYTQKYVAEYLGVDPSTYAHYESARRTPDADKLRMLGESYLAVLYDYLHKKLYDYHVIQADETPVLVNRDGRSAGSRSYMWVYRSGHLYTDKQIVLYDYHKTRNSSHPREFLSNYSGICATDGYQVYHTIEKEREDLKIAGCWVYARRKFDEALTVIPKAHRNKSGAFLVIKQIQAIYREEGKLNELSSEERLM